MEERVPKLFMAFAFAFLLLPGFARAAESCHHGKPATAEEAPAASGLHAGHAHSAALTDGIEEVPQAVPVSSVNGHKMKEDCLLHPAVVQTCSTQRALMKCGMHGCCLKSETPPADDGSSPKVAPEMAIDASQGLYPLSLKGLAAPYLLATHSNRYPPVPRPPSA